MLALVLFAACLNQPTSGAQIQQTATEFNSNARFGRLEVAEENVAPAYREAFERSHAAWGKRDRIADTEVTGFQRTAKEEALVRVQVSWYRSSDGDMKSTTLKQTWRDHRGSWMLAGEERESGDLGLLGETVERVGPEHEVKAQFPTVTLGQDAGTTRPLADPGRSRDELQAQIIAHRDEARACYDAALRAHPKIEGTLDMRWVIDEFGKVIKVDADDEKSDIHERSVVTCIGEVLKKMSFPPSELGVETHVHYPYNFHPRGRAEKAPTAP